MTVYSEPEFLKFSKIPRLFRQMVITEKIDGTNGQILITDDLEVWAGSRKRWLGSGPTNDNYGFCSWVQEHGQELARDLGPGRHFGEWWGKGINRNYGQERRRFSLFNVRRWQHRINKDWESTPWLAEYEKRQNCPDVCETVPILYIGPFCLGMVDNILATLAEAGSSIAPGFMKPEGVVVYHRAGNHLFKVTMENDAELKERE